MKYYKLYYYYNSGCSACKNYETIVNKVAEHYKIDSYYINTDKGIPQHHIEGLPTIIIDNETSKTVFKNTGNLAYEPLITLIDKKLNDKPDKSK